MDDVTTTTSFTEQVLAIMCKPEAVAAMKSGGVCPSFIERISQHIPLDVSNTTDVANERETLEREIDDKATEIIGQFSSRIEYELLPLLYRMRGLLPHGEWGNWFERFRTRVRFQWTIRNVQRKFKELEDGWKADPAAKPIRNLPSPALTQEQATAAKNLADAKEQLGPAADAGNEPAAAILAGYEEAYAKAMADTASEVETAGPISAEEVYKLLAPLLYSYYLRDTMTLWHWAAKAQETTGEKVPEGIRVRYYENYIVRNRKSLDVPWPSLAADDTLPISTRLAKGIGPPMWLCIPEPNGDTIECFIDRADGGKCTRVRRVKMGTAATNDEESDTEPTDKRPRHPVPAPVSTSASRRFGAVYARR